MVDAVEVQKLIEERQELYGHPSENFADIARGWSVLFGCEITAKQVGLAMIWLKVCRENHHPKEDNVVDIVGYAIAYDMVEPPTPIVSNVPEFFRTFFEGWSNKFQAP